MIFTTVAHELHLQPFGEAKPRAKHRPKAQAPATHEQHAGRTSASAGRGRDGRCGGWCVRRPAAVFGGATVACALLDA